MLLLLVTFKDLQKVIQSQSQSQPNSEQQQKLYKIRGKAFWYWDKKAHKERDRASKGDCCFNHIIGPPRKDGIEKPLFGPGKTVCHRHSETLCRRPLSLQCNKT